MEAKRNFRTLFFLVFYVLSYLPLVGCLSVGNPPKTEQQINQRSDNLLLVERVVDGDTFVITGGERVRLIGVDAPDARLAASSETYGKEAAAFTREKIEGMHVKLVYDVQQRDQYGRLLAYVYLEDGKFFNELLVREGYAQVYTVAPNVARAEILQEAQRHALENKLGLWGLSEVLAELDKLWLNESGQGLIKGNIRNGREKIYHLPGGRYYQVTRAELWFKTEREAVENGFRKSRR
ncbi:MAG: thermonuclease family protein [Firmicutes bacterium]|nr:thermonuclease family protein [Bacillota bacterium]